jgi:hypothetical protein
MVLKLCALCAALAGSACHVILPLDRYTDSRTTDRGAVDGEGRDGAALDDQALYTDGGLTCNALDLSGDGQVDLVDYGLLIACKKKKVADKPACAPLDGDLDGLISESEVSWGRYAMSGCAQAGALTPCVGKVVIDPIYTGTMASCDYVDSGIVIDQCGAGDWCNVNFGWHLCSPSEFLDRGGRTIATSKDAWLAGCIRDGSVVTKPEDRICSKCSSSEGAALTYSWACDDSMSYSTVRRYVGVIAADTCRRIGANEAAYGAYWSGVTTSQLLRRVLCCR